MNDMETNIDEILMFINEDIESQGARIKQVHFDFDYDQGDLTTYANLTGKKIEDIHEVIRRCISREYLEHAYMGGGEFGGLRLTQDGQARAISAKLGKSHKNEQHSQPHIGTINSYAPMQVGNYNIQNIKGIFEYVEQLIEKADASDQDKIEAKSLLAKFLEHPVVCAVIGGIAGGLASRV